MLRKHNSRRKQQKLSNHTITGVVDPLPTTAEIYGSDDALPHTSGLKGGAAKAAAAAAFPTPLVYMVNDSVLFRGRGEEHWYSSPPSLPPMAGSPLHLNIIYIAKNLECITQSTMNDIC